ncbi:MAG: biotin--[Clostridia bacterium]|nr:biotin--[acetyl-CoA-carboxylase] ligase [Clostridia bacterium]
MHLKIELLKLLEGNRDRYLSGQAIATHFGLSRNAVWKAVRALMAEGYRIEAVKNRGYRLSEEDDMLSAVGIAGAIRHPTKGMAVYLHREIDSTNNEAKRLIAEGKGGLTLIAAEAQTAGRGRQGKSFYSPGQTGIYMTLSAPTDLPMADAVSLTSAAAVAVWQAIKDTTGITTEIKWVNDIYLGGKKVAGILTEAISDLEAGVTRHVIIGVGVNVRTTDFPPELGDIAASLSPVGVNRNRMIAAITDRLLDVINRPQDTGYLVLYRKHSMVIGREIVYTENGVTHHARALDIDDFGGLVIERAGGVRGTLRSGEISVRLDT